jgi:septation ring formation regulator EzrA
MSDNPILAALARLEAGQTTLRSDLTAIRSDLTAMLSDQTAMRSDLTAVRSDQIAMRSDLTAFRSDLTALRSDLTVRMDGLETGHIKLRVDLMERMDRLQHSLDLTKDDIGVNFGTAERTERIAQAASDEGRALAVVVRVMQRQIARLQTDVEALRGPTG